MKTNLQILIACLLCFCQMGCSASLKEKEGDPKNANAQIKKSYILGGMNQEQAQGLEIAIKKADEKFSSLRIADNFEKQGENEKAITAYQNALSSKDTEFMARMALARLYEKLGYYDKAAEQIEIALPQMAQWGKPQYEKKLAELRAKATH